MELRRFFTAGEVDDGKSTLIGRLFLDAGRIHQDQLESIKGNLAHFTDGLREERTQGITMDVAYRFFETSQFKFIVADAPGHLPFIRHMVSAASLADAAVILVDATRGVSTQTRRHAWLARWLGVPSLAFLINKMDQKEFDPKIFSEIKAQLNEYSDATFIPASALHGDNIIQRSTQTPWYNGPALMTWLESIPSRTHAKNEARFSVQHVLSDKSVTGQLLAGEINVGDELLSSQGPVTVQEIHVHPSKRTQASEGEALRLIVSSANLVRGNLLYRGDISHAKTWEAEWLFFEVASASLMAQSHAWRGQVEEIEPQEIWDWELHGWAQSQATELPWLQRGTIKFSHALTSDEFGKNNMGQMILVDSITGRTVAAVLLKKPL